MRKPPRVLPSVMALEGKTLLSGSPHVMPAQTHAQTIHLAGTLQGVSTISEASDDLFAGPLYSIRFSGNLSPLGHVTAPDATGGSVANNIRFLPAGTPILRFALGGPGGKIGLLFRTARVLDLDASAPAKDVEFELTYKITGGTGIYAGASGTGRAVASQGYFITEIVGSVTTHTEYDSLTFNPRR